MKRLHGCLLPTLNTATLSLLCLSFGVDASGQSQSAHLPTYDISVRIVPGERRLEVSGEVTLPGAAAPRNAVQLQLDLRFTEVEVVVVAPAALAGPTVVSRTGNAMTVEIPGTLPGGASLVLRFAYAVSSGWGRSFYAGRDGAMISGEAYHWYPIPAGTRRATGRLRFIAPDGFTVAATGRRLREQSLGEGVFAFDVTDATTFSFAAGRHRVYRSEGSPSIALHLLRDRPRIPERLQQIRRIVSVLETEFGPFPHPDLEIVEMPPLPAGDAYSGTSLEGFVVAGHAQMDSFNLAFLAHEIGHQWWADSLFATGKANSLLTEAMAQYASLRAVEAVYGAEAAKEFRWRGYPGSSMFEGGLGYMSLMAGGVDASLSDGSLPILAANKGVLVHDLLAQVVGRAQFREFLRTFVRTHAFQDITWTQFVDELMSRGGEDLRWFFEQWYGREGLPELSMSWTQRDRQLHGVIVQSTPHYRADIDILVVGSRRQLRHRVRIDAARTEFVVPVGFPVTSVTADPDYEVPHVTKERKDEASIVVPLGQAMSEMLKGGSDFITAARAVYAALPGADEPRHRFIADALELHEAYRRGDDDRARDYLERALANPSRVKSMVPEMQYIRAVLARGAGNRALLEKSVKAAVEADDALIAPSGWGAAAQDLLIDAH
jgi:Peptidase family M1 domain